jgi:hypothetical protein
MIDIQALKQERDALTAQVAQLQQQQSAVQHVASTTAATVASGAAGSTAADHSVPQVSRLLTYAYHMISLLLCLAYSCCLLKGNTETNH